MSDSAPPPPPPENQGGATPPPPPPAAPPPPPASPYGSAPPPPPSAPAGPRPGELLDRFVARLIDLVILFMVNLIISLVLVAIFFAGDSVGGLGMGGGFVYGAVTSVISAVIYLGYFAFLESSRGQTIGKQVMKLRVVSASGSGNPTMEEAVKRNIWAGLGILGVVPFLGIIGGLLQLAAVIVAAVTLNSDLPRHQSWFDKFAGGTQVLKG